jgi:hypothetical protein
MLGLLGRVAKKKPYLRLANKNKILRWAKEHRHWTEECCLEGQHPGASPTYIHILIRGNGNQVCVTRQDSPGLVVMIQFSCNEHHGRQRAGFKRRAQQVFICKGPQEEAGSWVQGQVEGHTQEAGSWVQGQVEGHTQGVHQGNSTGREKVSNVFREIRQ